MSIVAYSRSGSRDRGCRTQEEPLGREPAWQASLKRCSYPCPSRWQEKCQSHCRIRLPPFDNKTMSSIEQKFDPKPIALGGLKGAFRVFLKDLQALPEDAFQRSFGPSTRTVADIVYEVNLVNDHVGMVIRKEEPFQWPDGGWIKAPAGFGAKEAVIEAFQKSSAKIVETIEGFSAEQLE